MKHNTDPRDTGWAEDLGWCPSQLTKIVYARHLQFTLYLRWRWSDPWSGSILYGDSFDYPRALLDVSPFTILERGNVLKNFYKDEEYKDAEAKLEKIWYVGLKRKIENLIDTTPELFI